MRRQRAILLLVAGATILLAGSVLGDWLPNWRGPAPGTSEWYWPYLLRPLSRWWAPVAATLLLFVLAGVWLSHPQRLRRVKPLLLLGLMAGHLLLQLALIYADRPAVAAELVDRTLSNLSGGYFEAAAEIEDVGEVLRTYPARMPGFISEHLRTHPPGLLLANWLAVRLFTIVPTAGVTHFLAHTVIPLRCRDLWLLGQPPYVAAALGVWSFLPLFLATLSIPAAYFLARRLLPAAGARLATALVATMPALLLFAPQFDQLFPVLALATFYFLQRGLEQRSAALGHSGWFFLSGLSLSLLTFLSLGNAALLLPLGLYAGLYLTAAVSPQPVVLAAAVRQVTTDRVVWRWGAFFAVGLATVWLAYWVGWGVTPWSVARVGLQQHHDLVNQYRRYTWWLIYNLVDLFIYGGPLLFLGFIAAVVAAVRSRSPLTRRSLALALAVFLIVLNLSGSTRAEVGRLWLFFMPLLAIVSAGYLAQALPGRRVAWAMAGLQLLLALSVGLAWRPVEAVIVVAERPVMPAPPADLTPLNIRFGDRIALAGYHLDTHADTVNLTLRWQAAGPALRPYTVFNHLLDSEGNLVAQQDNWPVSGQWPPTCWQAGEAVVDPYILLLPADLAPGRYQLYTGLYDAATGERLHTADGRDAVLLQEIMLGNS